MPDIVNFATTGVVYKNGSIVVGATVKPNINTINVKIERSIVVAQSGTLDSRFDDKTYYTT
jgi:hypothetical protein